MGQVQGDALEHYPHGRGYGHDYMRGGEVLGGYGYAEREEYEKRRGEPDGSESDDSPPHRQFHGGQEQAPAS